MKNPIKNYYSQFSATSLKWLFWIYLLYPLAAILCTPILELEDAIQLPTSLAIIFIEVFGSHLLFSKLGQHKSEDTDGLSIPEKEQPSLRAELIVDTIRRFISCVIIYAGISLKEGLYYVHHYTGMYTLDTPFFYAKRIINELMISALMVFAISTIAIFLCKVLKKAYLHYIILFIALLLYTVWKPEIREPIGSLEFDAKIDGLATIVTYSGEQVTQDMILDSIEHNKEYITEYFKSGAYISTHGYYAPDAGDDNIFSYYSYHLPVVYEGNIVGDFVVANGDSGVNAVLDYRLHSPATVILFTKTLLTNKEVVIVHSNFSIYAITKDNVVITLKGDDTPTIKNPDKLYETWNLEYNLVTDEIFNSEDAYYTVP